jgi:hypothetical protein
VSDARRRDRIEYTELDLRLRSAADATLVVATIFAFSSVVWASGGAGSHLRRALRVNPADVLRTI